MAASRVNTHGGRLPPELPRLAQNNVAPNYQLGIVSLASRAAASTTIGSWGVSRYGACNSASARRRSSASSTATARLRRSADRFVPRSAASRSSRATRSSSNCTNTSRRPIDRLVTHLYTLSELSVDVRGLFGTKSHVIDRRQLFGNEGANDQITLLGEVNPVGHTQRGLYIVDDGTTSIVSVFRC
jgi:hypothetical protein